MKNDDKDILQNTLQKLQNSDEMEQRELKVPIKNISRTSNT